VNFAYLVDNSRIEEDALGTSGFAGIDVCSYSDIPGMLKYRWALT
jgi:hypothetical protein